jgi:hypothetical protein
VILVKGEGLTERGEDAGGAFIGEEAGEAEAGVVIDGDVEGLDAGPWVALGSVAGGADAGACEAAQFLDVEVEEVTGMRMFVADGRGFWGSRLARRWRPWRRSTRDKVARETWGRTVRIWA